ncbi:glycosyl transferase family 64 domain-domain-containing protein [Leucosporidium creatinivorum]|uniref:Glycosyl transferase family 64 domain-domain-containing protein n=1 Tax=Leucosporidium creatinivorum TaxID=106004 RepID=A0A1Y2ED03_9BASI|nr:glycosyl transferase family 64 domain-domain-containing protein [Leucosporidium creatinivorum]
MPRFHLFQSLVFALAVLHCIVLVKLGVDTLSYLFNAQDESSLLKRATGVSAKSRVNVELQLTVSPLQQWPSAHTHAAPIHLLLTSTASYNTGLLALVNSTLSSASAQSLPRLHFHIVSSNQVEANEVAELLLSRIGARVEGKLTAYGLAEVGDERLEGVKVWGGYRSEQLSKPIVFARYLVQDILPDRIDRVIYLDQDVLVQKDLAPLWDVDLQGHPLAAARLCRPTALWRKQFVMNKQPLIDGKFDHDTCTLNNGVLVYDLQAWRTASPSFTDELFEWTRKNTEDKLYTLGSQPPFNLVLVSTPFSSDFPCSPPPHQLMDLAGIREDTEYGSGLPATRSREDVDSAAILHWNGMMKPWLCDGEGYYSEIWTRHFPDFRDSLPADSTTPSFCSEMVITDSPVTPSVEKFTVVVVAFARVDTLLKIIRHLQHSPFLYEIVIAWNNQDHPCPDEFAEFPWVRCIQQSANLVHNRFLIWTEVKTEAVLHYDDDVLAPLEDLEAAFQLWRSRRDQIIGFEPRLDRKIPEGCQYRFKLPDGYFDIVIGKLFMISVNYMRAYFENASLVDLSNNSPCEDIAMNFLTATLPLGDSLLPAASPFLGAHPPPRAPLLFKSNLTEIHSKGFAGLSQGISSSVWREKRHECVQRLMGIFEGVRPAPQTSFFERDPVRRRVYKLPVQGKLELGWCSDTAGSRVCRQP